MKKNKIQTDAFSPVANLGAGQELFLNAKKFKALVENNDAIIALLDKNLNTIFRSSSSTRITGWNHDEFVKIAATDYVHPDDKEPVRLVIAEALSNPGKTISLMARVLHKAGNYLWLEGSITNMLHDEEIQGIITNMRDITEKKAAEEKMQNTKRLYYFISNINQMIVRTTDEATLFKEACTIAVELGQFRMAWIGIIDEKSHKVIPVMHAGEESGYLSEIQFISVEDVPAGRGPTGVALREGRSVICNDIENDPSMLLWKNAALNRHYLSSMCVPIKKFGKVVGAFSLYANTKNFFNDDEIALLEEATDDIAFALENFEREKMRKRAEQALFESERRYQTLTEMSPAGIFHTDETGYTTYVNPRWCQISGLKKEEALGNGWLKAVHKADRGKLSKGWQKATKASAISRSEYRFVRPDGSIRWVLGEAIPERDAKNQIVGYIGTTTDITERKISEEAIAKIYRDNNDTLNRINDAIISLDNEWRYTFLNDAALATHPDGREKTLGRFIWEVHPEFKQTDFWAKYNEAMDTRKVVYIESYYEPLKIWFSGKIYPSDDGLTIYYTDITERKKAAEEIANNDKKFKALIQNSTDGLTVIGADGIVLDMSPSGSQLLGYDKSEIIGKRRPDLIHPDDQELVISAFTEIIKDPDKIQVLEYRHKMPDGKYKWLECCYNNLLNEPILNAVVLNYRDITERKEAQDAILIERNLSDSIINSLPGVFYLYTEAGKFLKWNKNFETVTQYNADEIRQMHPLDFIDTIDKTLIAEKIANTFSQGEDNVQADLLLKTKKKIPYYFTGKTVKYGETRCMLGVGIDFTDRLNAQEKIRETSEQLRMLTAHLQDIREEERKRIGREIHDELGQQLTAIKMDVAWLDKKMSPEETIFKNKLKNIIELLDGSNKSIRRILSELRPGILDHNGLPEALEWLGIQFTDNTGIPVHFTSPETAFKSSAPVVTCIFRVYQEALTNIKRHAGSTKVSTSLSIEDDFICFKIEDNGKGFTPGSTQSHKSFGLLGMKERVLSLGGIFELNSSIGKGTKIIIKLPVDTQIKIS